MLAKITISPRCPRAIPKHFPLCSAGDGYLRPFTRYQRRKGLRAVAWAADLVPAVPYGVERIIVAAFPAIWHTPLRLPSRSVCY